MRDTEKIEPKPRKKSPERALSGLMFVCARAEKSSGDALRIMNNWGVDPAERTKILDKLVAEKFIDDARFAAAYVREKSRLSGWGEYRIHRQLALKGISQEIADEALRENELPEGRLEELLLRKIRTIKAKNDADLRAKLFRAAATLGHDFEHINKIINKILKENE